MAKATKRRVLFDEELARKLCTPENNNRWVAEQLGVSASYMAKWRAKNNLMSAKSATHAENAAKRKRKYPNPEISRDARMARDVKMNYGSFKAMQLEEQKKAKAKLLLGKKHVANSN